MSDLTLDDEVRAAVAAVEEASEWESGGAAKAAGGESGRWWHGGSRVGGDLILPSAATGVTRSGDARGVFVTTDRDLAATYASTVSGQAWVYEVEPLSEPEPVTSLVAPLAPPISFTVAVARIIRRYSVSNAERRLRSEGVADAIALLDALADGSD